MNKTGQAEPSDTRTPHDEIAALDQLIRHAQGIVGDRSEQASWLDWLRGAGMTLAHPIDGQDAVRLREIEQRGLCAARFLDSMRLRSDAHSARWVRAVALRRLRRPAEALDVQDDITLRLEQDRLDITDPLRRAGVLAAFPQLAIASVENAADLGDPIRILAAIEAAKGRALADLLTRRDGKAADETALRRDPGEAADLARQLGVHYLSFLIVPDAAFAVLVTRAGDWHWKQLETCNRCLAAIVKRLQPDAWKPIPGQAPFDLGAALVPLIGWLQPLLSSGVISEGDHVVYSPDGLLHQLPLHMAHCGDRPIADRLLLSRVHGLDALRRIAARPPARPDRALGLFVPTQGETGIPEKREAAHRTLASASNAASWPNAASIDMPMISAIAAPDVLLYFNAHGVFPEATIVGLANSNPYDSAGLVIAHEGGLPQSNSAWPGRMTPKLVLESGGLDLSRSTVILQGCVSGLAKEGVGGDALGLEWAMLTKGAATVLASHWHVNFRSAGAFCRHFVQSFLDRKTSRIAAWQHARTETARDPEGGKRHDCDAFSLSGDWR